MTLTLAAGTRLGPYEILSPLGAGGMGEVYRARDTRLGRDVAVKVLPQHLSSNPDIRARFEREARSISSLNHPNICTLFDVGHEGDVEYLVMELVDGVTLADRLTRGPLPAAELLRIGRQVADALDRAHRSQIIHRDLKPGNIMLTKSGAKLMDFGLARAVGVAGGPGSGTAMTALTHTPTVAQALTAEGTLVGTFQYMAPEQLEGGEADARSDIWALGCVLYEMASGRRPFDGRSQASLIAAILEREPVPLAEAPSGSSSVAGASPAGLGRIIRNCLAKDPDDRSQTAHDVKLQLDGVAEGLGLSTAATPIPGGAPVSGVMPAPSSAIVRGGPNPLWWLATIGLALTAGLAGAFWPRPKPPAAPVVRFRLEAAPGIVTMNWPRLSPDGQAILFAGIDSNGVTRTYVRPIDQLAAVPVAGSEGVNRAYWSPDGREVAFVSDQKIKRVTLGGGAPVIVCSGRGGADVSWGSGGHILMDGTGTDSLQVVAASGGELKPATRIYRDAGEVGSAWPCFLPDGQHFLFIGNRSGAASNIRLGRLGSLDSKLIGTSDGRVEYAGGGWVLYLRGRTLLAQKLDLGKGQLVGDALTLADDIWLGRASGHFSASASGGLAYRTGTGLDQATLIMADRQGRPIGEPLLTVNGSGFELSPDGGRLLYCRSAGPQGNGGDIHVFDLTRRTDTALTFTRESASSPFWSPDGRRFACAAFSGVGLNHLLVGNADGLGKPDSLGLAGRSSFYLSDWAPTGAELLCWQINEGAWRVPVTGQNPVAFSDQGSQFYQPRLSPDGRWVVGTVGSNPDFQIFVFSTGQTTGRWPISQRSSIFPTWTKGGREIIFEELSGGMLMAADVEIDGGFRAGTVRPLFRLPSNSFGPSARSWGVDAAGERFFLSVPPPRTSTGNIEVLTSIETLVNRK